MGTSNLHGEQSFGTAGKLGTFTLSLTNMEVENGPLEDYFPLRTEGELNFHVMCSSEFRFNGLMMDR